MVRILNLPIKVFKRNSDKVRRDYIAKSSLPLISIVLPVYNSEVTIELAIKSIQNQGYKNWELLVIDDGSNDASLDTVKKLSESDSRIKVFFNKKNKGVAYSRNIGLKYATGDFITFHDADDKSHSERLEYQLFYALRYRFKIVIAKYVRVSSDDVPFIINGKSRSNHVSGMMIPRNILSEIGFFKNTRISEDSEYHERILAFYGKKSRKLIDKILYFALYSPSSLLFSNADVEVKGNKINYKITNKHASVLSSYRQEHKQIKAGKLSPYQSFEIDEELTSVIKE